MKWLHLTQRKGLGAEREAEIIVNMDNVARVVRAEKTRGDDGYTKLVFVGGEVISVVESDMKITALLKGDVEIAYREEPNE